MPAFQNPEANPVKSGKDCYMLSKTKVTELYNTALCRETEGSSRADACEVCFLLVEFKQQLLSCDDDYEARFVSAVAAQSDHEMRSILQLPRLLSWLSVP